MNPSARRGLYQLLFRAGHEQSVCPRKKKRLQACPPTGVVDFAGTISRMADYRTGLYERANCQDRHQSTRVSDIDSRKNHDETPRDVGDGDLSKG